MCGRVPVPLGRVVLPVLLSSSSFFFSCPLALKMVFVFKCKTRDVIPNSFCGCQHPDPTNGSTARARGMLCVETDAPPATRVGARGPCPHALPCLQAPTPANGCGAGREATEGGVLWEAWVVQDDECWRQGSTLPLAGSLPTLRLSFSSVKWGS